MQYLTKKNKKKYYRMITRVAEQLWEEVQNSEIGPIIFWENFLREYIKDGSPRDDIERLQYVRYRTHAWVPDINAYFRKKKYPCRLAITRNKEHSERGIQLQLGNDAVYSREEQRIRQFGSFCQRTTEEMREMQPAYTKYTQRHIDRFLTIIEGAALQVIGAIELDPQIPRYLKRKHIHNLRKNMTSNLIEYKEEEEEEEEKKK